MDVAVVHYHLNRGGVTRVIVNHLQALERALSQTSGERVRVALLFDGQMLGWPHEVAEELQHVELHFCPVARLAYDQEPRADGGPLADELAAELQRLEFHPDTTLLHAHNHSLGKNASVPPALTELARRGFRLLLQIHDFAEDFRPDNYRHLVDSLGRDEVGQLLYPQASHIHYAVLNQRDRRALEDAGVPAARLHWLPNPVTPFDSLPDRTSARTTLQRLFGVGPSETYLLYPVRGIRRKNVGEALLWSALCGRSVRFAMTLAPLNPREVPLYEQWKLVAAELRLPFLFETGAEGRLSFEQNLVAADGILTTSVAEGFGMVFLEAWLAGRPLFGRDLPEITADFTNAGLQLDTLYRSLPIPVDWVGRDRLTEQWRRSYQETLHAYGLRVPDADWLNSQIERKLSGSHVDFADLTEALQERVLRKVATDASARRQVVEANPTVRLVLDRPLGEWQERVEQNRRVVEQNYSLEASGRRLLQLYQQVLASERSEVRPLERPESILRSFLSFRRFRPIRG